MNRLPISVIIPVKNGEKFIEQCLESVKINNAAEIIVVDGLSKDKTLEIAVKYTSLIYSDNGLGAGFAHQIGAEKATQEYIAYVDSDIILPPNVLSNLINELKEGGFASVAATVEPANTSTYWERAIDWNSKLLEKRRKTGGLQATVLKKDTVLKYGFDAFITHGDDLDFTTRLQKDACKQKISYIFVYHHHRADCKSVFKARANQATALPRLIKKYGVFNPRFWPPLILLYWIALSVLKGKPQYIPYFLLNFLAQSLGMLKGLFNLKISPLK
ncbi:MAG: glycosyltransferase family 2 protein [Dehalococcoidales bacterium]